MALPTETAVGRAWVNKYLHPPSIRTADYNGTPDNNTSPYAILEYDVVQNISPSFLNPISGEQLFTSDLMFLQGSGALVVTYAFVRHPKYLDGKWQPHPQTPAVVNTSYDFPESWRTDVSMHRLSYKSCTYYLNATAFNDQGTVTTAQFRPQILVGWATPADDELDVIAMPRRPVGVDPDFNAQWIVLGNMSDSSGQSETMPPTASMVQQSSPKAITHMAKDGVFVPQTWAQPVNAFKPNPKYLSSSLADLPSCQLEFYDNQGSHTIPLFNASTPTGVDPTKPNTWHDITWSDFTWAYVLFSGLSAPTTQITTSTAYITVKCVYGIEVQPMTKSPFNPFMRAAPVPDDRAVHIAAAIAHQKPDAFPASANDFGTILALAAQFAPQVISWISNAFRKTPTESPVAKPKPPRTPQRAARRFNVPTAQSTVRAPNVANLVKQVEALTFSKSRRRWLRRPRNSNLPNNPGVRVLTRTPGAAAMNSSRPSVQMTRRALNPDAPAFFPRQNNMFNNLAERSPNNIASVPRRIQRRRQLR